MTALAAIAAALCVAFATLLRRARRAGRVREQARLGYLDLCRPLFEQCRTGRTTTGFPRMAGHYRGHPCDLQVVPDTLTFRKLPALWVLVTIPEPLGLRATLDLMRRPNGGEPFSAIGRLQGAVAAPSGFPEDCVIRSDDPARAMAVERLRPHLSLFDDPRIKELVISPKGVRVVFLAEEADRTRYLLFRDAEMGAVPLEPDRVCAALDRLVAIRADLAPDGLVRDDAA